MFSLKSKKKYTKHQVGIEMNPSGLSMVHVAWKNEDPVIMSCETIAASELENNPKLFKKLVKSSKVGGLEANYVLHPAKYDLLLVEKPDVPKEELNDAAKWAIKDMIPYAPTEAVIDCIELPDNAFKDQKKMIYVSSVRQSVIEDVTNLFKGSGLKLKSIDIYELALRNVAYHYSGRQESVALLRMRKQNGLLNISNKDVLYLTRQIDMGLDEISEDSLILEASAHGSRLSNNKLDSLVLEIQRSLDYFEIQQSQGPVHSFLLAPLKVDSMDVQACLNDNLNGMVELMDINRGFVCEMPIDQHNQIDCIAALGGALRCDSAPENGDAA